MLEELVPILPDLYNYVIYTSKEIPQTWNEAKIILLLKPNKDARKVEAYRPIALLNTDYKIMAAILARHLNNILNHWVHPDQTSFIKTRQMKDNTRKIFNIIDYAQKNHIPVALFFADAEKGFDMLEWNFLKKVIEKIGLGGTRIAWLEAVYKEPQARIQVNNLCTETIYLTWGVRQGCPLSPLLFNICTEAHAITKRQDKLIDRREII